MVEEDRDVYLPIRRRFLLEKYPDIDSSKIEKLAKQTRGLIFSDIILFVNTYLETKTLPVINIDKYNTCNPKTGNWTERILSKKQYRKIISSHHFQVTFENGFYDVRQNNRVLSMIAKFVNFFIQYSGMLGSKITPFIFLTIKPTFKILRTRH